MEKSAFTKSIEDHASVLEQIRTLAHQVHASVNQHYDQTYPYAIHLDRVADTLKEYLYEICQRDEDVVPVMFGAYFHDSIEDARLTYNNVMHLASRFMDPEQAHLATEIVYALTNEKGRTRAERANSKYYQGIRNTPYAPICKIADRIANISYSIERDSTRSTTMRHVYAQENPHFITEIIGKGTPTDDLRMHVPAQMITDLKAMLENSPT